VKSRTISVRRRQLMIAGFAGTAAPALAGQLHEQLAAVGQVGAVERAGGVVVSGRILAGSGRPLAGATVEIWRANARGDAATATTDGDGRFFAKVASDRPGRPRHIHYHVSDGGRTLATQELYFARGREVAERRSGHLERDEAGTWRAAFGISLA
jgi:protocatechuate 3,4-dioxygenase beta subunit